MLPSLVAEDLRASLTSFLGTTFALGDDDVRAELERFVADPERGVFRGPYVRLRLPFRPADEAWRGHLDRSPGGSTGGVEPRHLSRLGVARARARVRRAPRPMRACSCLSCRCWSIIRSTTDMIRSTA